MILCSSTLWLNDAIINAAQMLLKQQAGDNYVGFQSTLLGKNLKYKLVEREKPLLQILHVDTNHWVTITTLDCAQDEVRIFDSAGNDYISLNLKQQICTLLQPQSDRLKFVKVDMQRQMDTNSCGLFAIAVATEIIAGGNPTDCKWDSEKMRPHLMECFVRKELTKFPLCGKRRNASLHLHSWTTFFLFSSR